MKINWSKKTIDAGFLPFAVDVKMSIRSVIMFILFVMPCHPMSPLYDWIEVLFFQNVPVVPISRNFGSTPLFNVPR